jgi:SHS2 domain-containing protein
VATPQEYFEHDADVGVVGRGATPEQAFVAAAESMFALEGDLAAVGESEAVTVEFEEPDLELALVAWLNALLGQARARNLELAHFKLQRDGDRWRGEGRGEPWQRAREHGVEVKGATLTALSVRRAPEGWEARCVVDV